MSAGKEKGEKRESFSRRKVSLALFLLYLLTFHSYSLSSLLYLLTLYFHSLSSYCTNSLFCLSHSYLHPMVPFYSQSPSRIFSFLPLSHSSLSVTSTYNLWFILLALSLSYIFFPATSHIITHVSPHITTLPPFLTFHTYTALFLTRDLFFLFLYIHLLTSSTFQLSLSSPHVLSFFPHISHYSLSLFLSCHFSHSTLILFPSSSHLISHPMSLLAFSRSCSLSIYIHI